MYENLTKHIRRFVDLSEEQSLVLHRYFKAHLLKKKEYLLKEGQVCRSMYFVEKGCLRMYFHTSKTTEQITQFALDSWWMSDYFSYMDQKPSEYYIQAVEKSEVYSIDSLLLEDLLAELPQMERYFRMVMQRAVAAAQLRIKYMFDLSKEEFYNHFISSFPEFVQRVPQYMIASYLGLTPEYVSELRKKKG